MAIITTKILSLFTSFKTITYSLYASLNFQTITQSLYSPIKGTIHALYGSFPTLSLPSFSTFPGVTSIQGYPQKLCTLASDALNNPDIIRALFRILAQRFSGMDVLLTVEQVLYVFGFDLWKKLVLRFK